MKYLTSSFTFTRLLLVLLILHFSSLQAKVIDPPSLSFQPFVSDNFPEEKRYMIEIIKEYISEILLMHKKIYVTSQTDFVSFRLIRENLQIRKLFKISPYLMNQIKKNINLDKNLLGNQFHFVTYFHRSQYKDFVQVGFLVTDRIIWSEQYTLNFRDFNKTRQIFGKKLRKVLCQSKCYKLQVTTEQKKSSVYMNGVYLGFSPIHLTYLPPGSYELQILKDGYYQYNEIIHIPKIKKKKISLKKINSSTSFTIKTQPENANVYIDSVYQGKSPLDLKNLHEGRHKLTTIKEGFHSHQRFFFIDDKEDVNINISLVSTRLAVMPQNHFWGFLTYQHLYITSFASSLLFFSTGVYFAIERSNTKEKLFVSLAGRTPENYTPEDQRNIGLSRDQENNQKLLSISFYTVSGIFLGLGLYLFIKDLPVEDFFGGNHYQSSFWLRDNLFSKEWAAGYTYHF